MRQRIYAFALAILVAAFYQHDALAAPAQIEVPVSATGGLMSAKDCSSGMVPAYRFASTGSVLITGAGTLSLRGRSVTPAGIPADPAAKSLRLDPTLRSASLPRQNIADGSRFGALIGAFVPKSITAHRSRSLDGKKYRTGAADMHLFFVGGGRVEFDAPGPGSLFLGINSAAACGDSGSFSVTIEVPVTARIYPSIVADTLRQDTAGVIPVAILSSNNFDSRTIDPATLILAAPALNLFGTSNDTTGCEEQDIDDDGLMDLVCQFQVGRINLKSGPSLAELQGQTVDGVGIRAEIPLNIAANPHQPTFAAHEHRR